MAGPVKLRWLDVSFDRVRRWWPICLVVAVASLLLFTFYYVFHNATWFPGAAAGVTYTMLVGVATFILAVVIYRKQSDLQHEVMSRIFGTTEGFSGVYNQVVSLIREANERKGSALSIMVYWLWFGADQRLQKNPNASVRDIHPYDSDVWSLLESRRIDGLETTVVTYDPDAQELTSFVAAVLKWQFQEAGLASAQVAPEDIQNLLARYKADVNTFQQHRKDKRDTEFRSISFPPVIPMLMFSVTDERNWCRGLICLAETEALKTGAKVGAFQSSDPRIVEVIEDQIRAIADASPDPKTEDTDGLAEAPRPDEMQE